MAFALSKSGESRQYSSFQERFDRFVDRLKAYNLENWNLYSRKLLILIILVFVFVIFYYSILNPIMAGIFGFFSSHKPNIIHLSRNETTNEVITNCPKQSTDKYLYIDGTKDLKLDQIRNISLVGSKFWGNYIKDDDNHIESTYYSKVCIAVNRDFKTRGFIVKVNNLAHWKILN